MKRGLIFFLGSVGFLLLLFLCLVTSGDREEGIRHQDSLTQVMQNQLREFDFPTVDTVVYIEVSINGGPSERIDIGLFTGNTPKTCENFRSLVVGTRGGDQTFVGTIFHRIISNFVIQGGNLMSIEGQTLSKETYKSFVFDDEQAGLELKHEFRYLVQMANSGPDTNNSQFCFMLKRSPHLNGKHVVFGHVMKGFEVVDKIEELASSPDGKPNAEVKITAGGEY